MKVFFMKACKMLQRATLLIGLLSVILPIVFWADIPEKVPTHYNASGAVDAWGGKGILLLLMVFSVIMLGMMFLATYVVKTNAVSKYSKEEEKVDNSFIYILLVWLNFCLELFFAYIIYACATVKKSLGTGFLVAFGVLILGPIVVVLYLRKKEQKKTAKGLQLEQEKNTEGQVWRSRVDLWLVILLLGSLVWIGYEIINQWVSKGKWETALIVTFLIMAVIILPLFSIKYVFYEDYLKVDCSVYGVERIPYDSITSMKKTMNPLSSAALSLRRLEIRYEIEGNEKMVLISPKNRDAFIEEVEKRKYERAE